MSGNDLRKNKDQNNHLKGKVRQMIKEENQMDKEHSKLDKKNGIKNLLSKEPYISNSLFNFVASPLIKLIALLFSFIFFSFSKNKVSYRTITNNNKIVIKILKYLILVNILVKGISLRNICLKK